MANQTVAPKQIAAVVGMTDKAVRRILRDAESYGCNAELLAILRQHPHGKAWRFTDKTAKAVIAWLQSLDSEATAL